MTVRRPKVDIAGEEQELPQSDTLPGVEVPTVGTTFTAASIIGSVVYGDGNDTVDLARANADGTSRPIGLALGAYAPGAGEYRPFGIITLTTLEWDALTGETGGLVANVRYFLSPLAAGMLKKFGVFAPAAGNYVVEIGVGLSTLEMMISIGKRCLKA